MQWSYLNHTIRRCFKDIFKS